MASRGRVQVSITADNSQLKRGLRDSEQDLNRLQKVGKTAGAGLGTALKGVGAAFAGIEIADQIKETVQAAEAAQVAQAKLRAQLKASGISYDAHAKQIDGVIKKTSELAGIAEPDLNDAFTNIVRSTGKVSQSLKLVGLAADIARAKHIDVAKAGQLVGKVAAGNTSALGRYGIVIQKGATATEALGALQKKFGGQAEAYGKTAAGAQDRFRVAVEELRVSLGEKLLPIITKVTAAAANFVNGLSSGQGVGGKFAAVMRTVGDAVGRVSAAVTKWVRDNHAQLESFGKDLAVIGNAFKKLFDGFILPVIHRLLPAIKQQFGGIAQYLKGAIEVISGLLTLRFGKVWQGVKDIFSGGIKAAVGTIRAFTAPARQAGSAIGGAILNGIKSGFSSAVGFMEDRFNNVIDAVNAVIDVFNKLPGPNIGKIPHIGGGGGGGSSSSGGGSSLSTIINAARGGASSKKSTHTTGASAPGQNAPGGARARAASVTSGVVASVARVTSGRGGATARAASAGGSPCLLTWYDPALGGTNSASGRSDPHSPTASGQPYDANAYTCAAPPSYAFGTKIEFTANGQTATCVVNDRGGAIQGNHFDLARAPATALGVLQAGHAYGTFRVVGHGTASSSARASSSSAASRPKSSLAVVAGGKFLQGLGLQVGESKYFGGVTTNRHAHYPNDHYSGNSIDVNAAGGGPGELVQLQRALKQVKARYGAQIQQAFIEDAGTANQHLHVTFKNTKIAAALGGNGTTGSVRLTAAQVARMIASPVTRRLNAGNANLNKAIRGSSGYASDIDTQIGLAQKQNDLTTEDTTTPGGRIAHIFEQQPIAGLQTQKVYALASQRSSLLAKVRGYRSAITGLTRQMRGTKGGVRQQLAGRIKHYQGLIAKAKADARALGFTIADAMLDLQGTLSDISDAYSGTGTYAAPAATAATGLDLIPGANAGMAAIDKEGALAALTADPGDDIKAAQDLVTGTGSILTYEQQNPGFTDSDIADAARNLKSAQDALDSLTSAVTDNTNAMTDLQAKLDLQTQIAQDAQRNLNTSQSQYAAIAKAIFDIANTGIGGRLGLGFQSVSYAGGVAKP